MKNHSSRIKVLICTSLSLAASQSTWAMTPSEYCDSKKTVECEVLNVEVLSNLSGGLNLATNRVENGKTFKAAGQQLKTGKVEVHGMQTHCEERGCFQPHPETLYFEPAVTNGKVPDPVTLPRKNDSWARGQYSGSFKVTSDEFKCVAPEGCTFNSVDAGLSVVPIVKKVCHKGNFEVIFKNQAVSDTNNTILKNDCSK